MKTKASQVNVSRGASVWSCLAVIVGAYTLGLIAACCPVEIIEIPAGTYLGEVFRDELDTPRQPELDEHFAGKSVSVRVANDRVQIEYQEQQSGERLTVTYDVVDEDMR